MPFTDRARIHVAGGHGGEGSMSFRREAHIPRGGPDGGNGGRGGSVFLAVDPDLEDLSRFRQAVHHRAGTGGHGSGSRRDGAAGADLVIAVPSGTRVFRDGRLIVDLDASAGRVQVARGGDGGVGNRAFRSSTNRAPRRTGPATAGEETWLTLELRLAVDAVLVGLPNSGKSALLRALTGAATREAPFPHSTREPAFGPLEDEYGEVLILVDLPGLAADGSPREHHHLAQIERARLLLHCLDGTDPEPAADRLARGRAGLAPWRPADAPELVIATGLPPGEPVPEADLVADCESGEGVAAVRERIQAILAGEP